MTEGSDCPSGKEQFASRATAQQRITVLRGQRFGSLNTYRCQYCGCVHIGNRRRTDKERKR